MKVIYDAISKTLLCHVRTMINQGFFYLDLQEYAAVNIGGTTIHFSLGIKPEIKLLDLNEKSKAALRNRLSEVYQIIRTFY